MTTEALDDALTTIADFIERRGEDGCSSWSDDESAATEHRRADRARRRARRRRSAAGRMALASVADATSIAWCSTSASRTCSGFQLLETMRSETRADPQPADHHLHRARSSRPKRGDASCRRVCRDDHRQGRRARRSGCSTRRRSSCIAWRRSLPEQKRRMLERAAQRRRGARGQAACWSWTTTSRNIFRAHERASSDQRHGRGLRRERARGSMTLREASPRRRRSC